MLRIAASGERFWVERLILVVADWLHFWFEALENENMDDNVERCVPPLLSLSYE